jgi:putative ABC transport system permease protein
MIRHIFGAVGHDMRVAVKTLVRAPAFSLVSIATLAIGIGCTIAAFSVLDTAVWRGLPYDRSELLQTVFERSDDGALRVPSYPTFRDWQAQSASISNAIAGMAFVRGDGVILPMPNGPERAITACVSPGFFQLMGTKPLLGRTFLPDEEQLGGPRVAILSYDYFLKQFGGDPKALGAVIHVDSVPTTIIGVMPHGFAYPNFGGGGYLLGPALWQPISVFEATHAALSLRGLHVDSRTVLRLRSDVDSARAATAMRTIAQRLATEYPVEQAHWTSIALQPIGDEMFGSTRRTITLISGAIALVLLLACANVANLSLVRMSARSREYAVRAALGAGRARIASHLLSEILLLALVAGAVGVWLATLLVGYMRSAATSRLPFASELAIDRRVLVFALIASLVTALLVGLLPAARSASAGMMQHLRAGASSAVGGRREARARNLLVGLQFALALTLLISAGLLIQSFRRMVTVALGYEPKDTIEFLVSPPRHHYEAPTEAAALYARIIDAVRGVPGVTGAAAAGGAKLPVKVQSEASAGGRAEESALYRPVSSEYRRTMRIPLVAGRWFTEDDMRSPVGFVVSRRLAQTLWPGGTALGKRVTVRRASQARADFGQPITLPVIGVIGDVREGGPEDEPSAEVYLPYTLEVWPWMSFVVRATNATRALPLVEGAVRGAEPALIFLGKPSVAATGIEGVDAERRFMTFVLTGFSICSLLLATVGLYGTVSYSVVQRTRELGVRIALGASAHNVIVLVMRDGLAFVLVGGVAGIAGALAATRVIRSMLFQTTATDISTFVVVPLLFISTAILASYSSARRAAATDPMIAMRGV